MEHIGATVYLQVIERGLSITGRSHWRSRYAVISASKLIRAARNASGVNNMYSATRTTGSRKAPPKSYEVNLNNTDEVKIARRTLLARASHIQGPWLFVIRRFTDPSN